MPADSRARPSKFGAGASNLQTLKGKAHCHPILVAIVGGSASGKTWLSERLERALAPQAVRLQLDDFYRDRSHLSLTRRARLNFDHPRAIDWRSLELAIHQLLGGRSAKVPRYDFKTHSRLPTPKVVRPRPLILLDGLWVLSRGSIRRAVSFSMFLDCPLEERLRRRMERDLASRGRTREAIEEQFRTMVEPMHLLHVAPQAKIADVMLGRKCGRAEVTTIARRLRELLRSDPSFRRAA